MDQQSVSEQELEKIGSDIRTVLDEMGKEIVGQKEVLTEIVCSLFCGGHVLLEGVPGLGKTLMINSLSRCLDLESARIQFTPDLMPADIIGTNILVRDNTGEKYEVKFQKGPVFTRILLADEINRATPKTQSALLEAMQESAVTVSGEQLKMAEPFMVLATQNPLEMEGTYPLPEAQLDRFFFKTVVPFPEENDLHEILNRTTGLPWEKPGSVLSLKELISYKNLVRQIPVSSPVQDYAVRLVYATHAGERRFSGYIRYGSSPRGAQSLILAGKFFAVLAGRPAVSFEDIKRAAVPSLRHRLILSFEGEAEGMSPDSILEMILEDVGERN